MRKLINKIPLILIISRIILGAVILLLSFNDSYDSRLTIFSLVILGFLTDFFDGYLARLLGKAE